MKQKLSKKKYQFLDEVLTESVDNKVIESTKREVILDFYEESQGFDFIKILAIIGATLVGLGILLIIGSNWNAIPPFGQLMILMLLLSGNIAVSIFYKDQKPLLSDALLVLSLLVFGASLFLINMGFNLNVQTYTLFFIWTLGALVLSSIYKDVLLFIAAYALAFLFIFNSFNAFIFIQLFILIGLFFALNKYFKFQKLVTFSLLAFINMSLLYVLNYSEITSTIVALILLVVGLLLTHIKHNHNIKIFHLVGLITVGISGLFLSFPLQWRPLVFIDDGRTISILFSILLALYALYMISKKHVVALVILSALITRYYFDTFIGFMPRALFFIAGGIIILILVFKNEKMRKEGEDQNDE